MTVEIRPTTGGGSFYVIDGKYAGLASHSNPKVDVAAFNKKRGYVNPTTVSAPAAYFNPFTDPNSSVYSLSAEQRMDNLRDTTAAENQPPPASSENFRPPGSISNMERAAMEIQQKIDDVGIDTFKRSDDARAVRFADGTNLLDKDILNKYGINKNNFLKQLSGLGVNRRNFFKVERGQGIGSFQKGLENYLLSRQDPEAYKQKKDAYTAGQAQKRKEERKDQRQKDRMDASRKQVEAETKALGLDSTKDFYGLGLVNRLKMAGADIGQLFDPKQGSLMGSKDDQGTRALGVSTYNPTSPLMMSDGGMVMPDIPTDAETWRRFDKTAMWIAANRGTPAAITLEQNFAIALPGGFEYWYDPATGKRRAFKDGGMVEAKYDGIGSFVRGN